MSFREFKSHTFRKGNFVSLVSPSFKKKVDRYKALKKKLRDGSLMAERSPDKRVEKVRIFPVAQNVERHDKEKEVTQQLSDFKNFIRHNNDFKFSPEVEVVKQLIPGSYEILKDEWGKLFIQKIGIDVEQFVK